MLGIHYPRPIHTVAVVQFESTNQGVPLCCNLESSNLSRVLNIGVADEDLYVGYVANSHIRAARRIPALLAEVIRDI